MQQKHRNVTLIIMIHFWSFRRNIVTYLSDIKMLHINTQLVTHLLLALVKVPTLEYFSQWPQLLGLLLFECPSWDFLGKLKP